jgi:hypothetical protein
MLLPLVAHCAWTVLDCSMTSTKPVNTIVKIRGLNIALRQISCVMQVMVSLPFKKFRWDMSRPWVAALVEIHLLSSLRELAWQTTSGAKTFAQKSRRRRIKMVCGESEEVQKPLDSFS